MDRSTLVTIVVAAVVGAVAKEAVAALFTFLKGTSVVEWLGKNLGALAEIAGVVVYFVVLVLFASSDAPVTALVVLEILGCALGMLVMAFSVLFRIAKFQVRRERARSAESKRDDRRS